MYQLSGKFINQLGDPDMCKDVEATELAILNVQGLGLKLDYGL